MLDQLLQNSSVVWHEVTPSEGSAVMCSHCNSVAFRVLGNSIVVVHRHHGQYHKTIVPLVDLGLVRVTAGVQ